MNVKVDLAVATKHGLLAPPSREFSTTFSTVSCRCWSLFSPRATLEELQYMSPTVSILAELPESLHLTLTTYLDTHPEWDQDQVLTAALSLFLMHNGDSTQAARTYLESLFHRTP